MRADEVIDVSAVAMIDVGGGALANVEVIGLEIIVEVSYTIEVLVGAIIGGTPGIGAEMSANDLAVVMTALDFVVPTLLAKPFFPF